MKNQILWSSLITGAIIVISASALVVSQSIPTPSTSMPTPSPTPEEPKVCSIPGTPTLVFSPTPSPTPVVNELSLEDVNAILKRMDSDCDGISDYEDNCVYVSNPNQKDRNKNKIGDACERKRAPKKLSKQRSRT